MQSYHIAPNGQQEGPHDLSHLEAMMKAGRLQASDLCWQEGMANWQPVSEVLPSLVAKIPPPLLAPAAMSHNPYAAPLSPPGIPLQETPPARDYGNFGRLAFIGAIILLNLIGFGIGVSVKDELARSLFIGFSFLVACGLYSLRLKNIGVRSWYVLLFLVPFLNALFIPILSIYALFAPQGYAQTKKLDLPAKIILGTFFGLIGLGILWGIGSALLGSR